jgi:IS30 family transposase
MERLSEFERNELWDRWEAGESQRSIARALDRSSATVRTN